MEEYSDRRSKAETAYLRRGSRFSSRNQSSEERTNHSIDKPGSSATCIFLKPRIVNINNQERPRYVHDSFKSSSSKVAPASSSKFPLSKFEERRRQPFVPGFDIAESSRRKADAKRLVGSKKIAVDNESSDTLQGESGFTAEQVPYPEGSHFTGHSGVSAHTVESFVQTASLSSRTQTQKHKEVNMGTPGASSSSLTNGSTMPGSSTMGLRPAYGRVSGGQIRDLKNLGCTSVPDAQPSGCPSEPVISRRFEFMRKRTLFDHESSSRSRNLSLDHSPPTDIRSTGHRIRMNERSNSQQIPRRSSRSHQESAVSVRTRRPSPHATRMSVPDEREDGVLSLDESSTRNVQPAQEDLSLEEVSTVRPFFVEFDNNIFTSSRRRCSERQLLVLERNLFGAFASYDRHRDMRMDIDNMSYEELLALEERIGSVSTALSEEQFTKCLRRSTYSQVASEVNKSTVDDMRCSICQEEYVEGEEVGRLPCEHRFHVCCIGQWLGQKNWCPVCKASAVPSKG